MATILLIEGNEANTQLAGLLLRKAGHTVLCAVDAETGVAMARADTAAIPVFALTALAMKEDQERSKLAGCDAYIAKPLRYQELYATISRLLLEAGQPTRTAERREAP